MSITKSKGRKLAQFLRNITVDSKLTTEGVEDGKIITTGGDLDTRSEDATSLVSAASVTSYVGTKLGDYVHGTHDIDLTFTGDVTGQGTITDMGHTSFNLTLDAETLPAQTGYAGKFLTTNGTSASWATVDTSNGDTAFGWGDHSAEGYLTSFTETDPTVPSHVKSITTTNISNWDTAYGWGNHSTQNYATQTYVDTELSNLVDSSPATLDTLNELAAALGDDPNFAATVSTNIGTKWTQDNTKIGNWDTAYSWGNHASAGYFVNSGSWQGTHTDKTRVYGISSGGGEVWFGYAAGKGNVIADGEFYANEGQYVLWNAGNDGSGSGLDADLLDGQHASAFASASHSHTPESIGAAKFINDAYLNSSTTTATFITELTNEFGCFNNSQVTLKCAWSYSGNSDLNTGHPTIGTIELAGCTIETWGGTYKHVRITRPNTGGGGHGVYEYNDQSLSYAPGWREIWTSESDGAGSGLDADLLDGQQGSYYLPTTGKAADADLLDGIDSSRVVFGSNSTKTTSSIQPSQTLPSGFYDMYNTNTPTGTWYSWINIRHNNAGNNHGHQIAGSFYDTNLWSRNIDNNTYGAWTKKWDTANDGSGSGLDADLLDGIQGSSFLRSDADDNLTSAIVVPTGNRNQGMFGTYDSYKTQHIWSMGTAYRNSASGSNFGNLYGAAYTYSNRVYTAKGTMGDGHQMVWCQNGTPTAAMGNHLWTSGNTYAAGFIYNSDKAFKENIEPLENSLDTILKLEGVKYTLKESGKSSIGFIAQDVEKVIPEFVEGDEGFKGVNYGQMVAVLTEAMKEQQKQIQDLRAEIEVLKNESK